MVKKLKILAPSALTSKKKKNPNQPNINKKNIILFLFLSLLVDNCILMHLEIIILCFCNFLILYGCLFGVLFFIFYFNFGPC